MYQSISLTVESIISFVKNGDTHFVVHGHVALTGDQVEHIISTGPLELPCCAVLARAKPGEHLSIRYMDVEDMGQTFRRYAGVSIEMREPVQLSVAPRAPDIPLPTSVTAPDVLPAFTLEPVSTGKAVDVL